ncbi:unnamed protein product [Arabidopsis lyrata]|nr:unnamed protein product [Arabidopsis lyrata]
MRITRITILRKIEIRRLSNRNKENMLIIGDTIAANMWAEATGAGSMQ